VTPDGLPGSLGRVAIAVKSHHTARAAALLCGRLGPQGYVVSFQNGLTAEAITAVTGPGRLVTSFVNFDADLLGPGHIMQGNIGTFRVGEPEGGVITPRVAELAGALPYAEPTANIMGYLWGKEAYGGVPAVHRREPGGPALAAAHAGHRPGGAGPGPRAARGLRRVRA
jgi:ketopantoate reductase